MPYSLDKAFLVPLGEGPKRKWCRLVAQLSRVGAKRKKPCRRVVGRACGILNDKEIKKRS